MTHALVSNRDGTFWPFQVCIVPRHLFPIRFMPLVNVANLANWAVHRNPQCQHIRYRIPAVFVHPMYTYCTLCVRERRKNLTKVSCWPTDSCARRHTRCYTIECVHLPYLGLFHLHICTRIYTRKCGMDI